MVSWVGGPTDVGSIATEKSFHSWISRKSYASCMVYEHIFGREIIPLSTINSRYLDMDNMEDYYPFYNEERIQEFLAARHNARISFGAGLRRNDSNLDKRYRTPGVSMVPEDRFIVRPPCIKVLLLNKEIHEEASRIAWETTRKCFESYRQLRFVIKAKAGPARQFQCLAKIQLNFTNNEYFNFFGLNVTDDLTDPNERCCGHYLRNLPRLRDLEMRFRNPYDGYAASPWELQIERGGRDYGSEPVGCQKVVVDRIMCFAFPFIKGVEKVKTVGAVKTSTRAKWEKVFQAKVSNRQYDYDGAMGTILTSLAR